MLERDRRRGEPVRQRVIEAAERLLRDGRPDFSMRDLASEADVSFATPFNQFGGKGAIMHALSTLRIEEMTRRFNAASKPRLAADRVALAVAIAVSVMLEEPKVNRAVMGAISVNVESPGEVWMRSSELWSLALGDGAGLEVTRRAQALRDLPGYLAVVFRGALSFWTAGELADRALGAMASAAASAMLDGYVKGH